MSNFLFERMLARSAPLLQQFRKHPLHVELCIKGTLPISTFETFAEQDVRYLAAHAKALQRISERFDDRALANRLRWLSCGIIQAELNVYSRYLNNPNHFTFFSVNPRPRVREFPIIKQYINHLFTTANSGSIEEAVASCVPCFWIYNKELGKPMSTDGSSNNYYASWIASYSSKKFTHATELIVKTMQELGSTVRCPILQERIIRAFHESVRCELGFYNTVMSSEQFAPSSSTTLHIPFQK